MAMDKFLEATIEEARQGMKEGGIPIGSILVHRGTIIGRGHNRRIQRGSPVLHAEMDALENAGRQQPRFLRQAAHGPPHRARAHGDRRRQAPRDLGSVFVPIGGGGLISGIAGVVFYLAAVPDIPDAPLLVLSPAPMRRVFDAALRNIPCPNCWPRGFT